jgi:hypothetical protein
MVHLTGEQLPIEAENNTLPARAQRMRAARHALVQAIGQDYGYDVLRWHQYLSSPQAPEAIYGEYTWSNLHEQFEHWRPNSDWQLAIKEAERLALEFPNCPHCGSFASMRKVSHGLPDAKEVMWLCNTCKKRMPVSSIDGSSLNIINEA